MDELSLLDFVPSVDTDKLLKVGMVFAFVEAPRELDLAILEADDRVGEVEEVDSVGDKNTSLLGQFAHDDLLEDSLFDIGVEGG